MLHVADEPESMSNIEKYVDQNERNSSFKWAATGLKQMVVGQGQKEGRGSISIQHLCLIDDGIRWE